jgi:hypothetical protein
LLPLIPAAWPFSILDFAPLAPGTVDTQLTARAEFSFVGRAYRDDAAGGQLCRPRMGLFANIRVELVPLNS